MKPSNQLIALAVAAALVVPAVAAAQAASASRLFSLDIGSDTEISDPAGGAGEDADPGDVYLSSNVAGSMIGTPYLDDAMLFGADPNPVQGVAATAAPVGVPAAAYDGFFDMDGYDSLDAKLYQVGVNPDVPLNAPLPRQQAPLDCVYAATELVLSFDDDDARGWRAPLGARVPVEGLSPAGATYGSAAASDELVRVDIDPLAGFPALVLGSANVATETDVHIDLSPDPFAGDGDDDDVDALDVAPAALCDIHYFTVDSEGRNGLSTSTIYASDGLAAPTVAVTAAHLGIPVDTNIDAFEFAWLPRANGMPPALAIIFSVADDAPNTAPDESGGLSPTSVYASFLTGTNTVLVDGPAQGFDDVDALAVMPNDPSTTDSDGDGVVDAADNCSFVWNPGQYDSNGDGFGNACDTDIVGDSCKTNFYDLAQFRAVFLTNDPDADFNASGTVDFGDLATLRSYWLRPPGPSGLASCGD